MTSPVIEPGYHAGRPAPNKGRSFPAEVLTPDEVTTLIKECSNRAPTGIRNRALITSLYRGGRPRRSQSSWMTTSGRE